MKIECEDCGAMIDKRGLASHRRGIDCRISGNVREMKRRGWRRCGEYWAIIRSTGAPHERVEDRITQRGYIGRRTQTGCSTWAPFWVAGVVASGLPTEERKELLRAGADGDDAAITIGLILRARSAT